MVAPRSAVEWRNVAAGQGHVCRQAFCEGNPNCGGWRRGTTPLLRWRDRVTRAVPPFRAGLQALEAERISRRVCGIRNAAEANKDNLYTVPTSWGASGHSLK